MKKKNCCIIEAMPKNTDGIQWNLSLVGHDDVFGGCCCDI